MRSIYIAKFVPFFSTIILIIIVGLNNQKQVTKLKLLTCDTPTLSLGTYLAISTGSGFICSYLFTSFMGKFMQPKLKKAIKSKDFPQKNESKINNDFSYDMNLIERDVNDPSPTINANFRVIGKINKQSNNSINNNNDQFNVSNTSDFEDSEMMDEQIYNMDENMSKSNFNDWNDNSYVEW